MRLALSNAEYHKDGRYIKGLDRKPSPKQSAKKELQQLDKLIAKANSRRMRLIKQFDLHTLVTPSTTEYIARPKRINSDPRPNQPIPNNQKVQKS